MTNSEKFEKIKYIDFHAEKSYTRIILGKCAVAVAFYFELL